MKDIAWVVGIVASMGAVLLVLDYRDHAKNKKKEKEKEHNSTFFEDIDEAE